MTALSTLKNRSGKSRLGLLVFLVVVAAVGYYGYEVGGVYWRKYQLDDTVQRDLSFAGLKTDQAVQQMLLQDIADLDLPISARNVRFSRTNSPRTMRVVISYTETVDLIFTKKDFKLSLDITRPF